MAKDPATPRSGWDSIARDHSPYCEATGPIVQEGFVAARIRDFHALQDDRKHTRSHSPMVPCPVPPWFQIYEPRSPSKTIHISSRTAHACRRDDGALSKRKLDANRTEQSTKRFPRRLCGDQADPSKRIRGNEKEILSPRALPPALAVLMGGFHLSQSNGDVPKTVSEQQDRSLRFKRSIAERLSSMIDDSWKSDQVHTDESERQQLMDFLTHIDQAANEAEDCDSNPNNQQLQLLWDTEDGQQDLECRASLRSAHSLGKAPDSEAEAVQDGEDSHAVSNNPKEKTYSLEMQSDTREQNEGNDPLGVEPGTSTISTLPSTRSRAKSLNRATSFQRKPTLPSKLRTASLSSLIDRHLSSWANLGPSGSQKQTHPGSKVLSRVSSTGLDSGRQTPLLPTTSGTGGSNTEMQRSRQSSIRSTTSWLSKFPRYRISLVDKSQSKQTPSSQTPKEDQIEMGQTERPPKNSRKLFFGNTDNEKERHDEPGVPDGTKSEQRSEQRTDPVQEKTNQNDYPEPTQGKVSLESGKEKDVWVPDDEKIPAKEGRKMKEEFSGSPLGENPLSYSSSSVRDGGPTFNSVVRSEDHEDVKYTTGDEFRKGIPHSTSQIVILADDTGNNRQTYASDRTIPTTTSGSVDFEVTDETSQHRSSRSEFSAGARSSTVSRARVGSEKKNGDSDGKTPSSNAPAHALRWEINGQERGIKRVQVIVSLDGAGMGADEEIFVEAKMLRRSKRGRL